MLFEADGLVVEKIGPGQTTTGAVGLVRCPQDAKR